MGSESSSSSSLLSVPKKLLTMNTACKERANLGRWPKAEWAIGSEAMRATGIIVLVKSN